METMRAGLPLQDIFQWDSVNWSRAMEVWHPILNRKGPLLCLEIGGREGGLSLLAALYGHQVICSDLENPEKIAKPFHEKHGVTNQIKYESINALEVPYTNHFDIIMVKSVITMIGRHGRADLQEAALAQIYKALKPGGVLLFAENLKGSRLHVLLRKHFVPWGNEAGYHSWKEVDRKFGVFKQIEQKAIGFLGAFGRSETQRRILGKMDSKTDQLWPSTWRYIVVGSARK